MKFDVKSAKIPEVLIITHQRFGDDRGFFCESFRRDVLEEHGCPEFVQDNHSRSTKGVLRGLHYQIEPAQIGKLVRCGRGAIFDVAVDVRKGSPTYAQWVGVELSDDNNTMLYVPEGFAHGFCALTDLADVFYKQTGYYSHEHDRGVRWDDPQIGIEWPVETPLVSEKDKVAPLLEGADNNFLYAA